MITDEPCQKLSEPPIVTPQTTDAREWVKLWFETTRNHPDVPNDEGAMMAWFATLIMTGFDEARRRYEPETWRERPPLL